MCHWESSRRPLYVKTIWTNGHHHAILTPEDPLLAYNRSAPATTEERKVVAPISRHKSATKVQIPVAADNIELAVSSIQLFLDGLPKERRPRSKRQSAVSMYQVRERRDSSDAPAMIDVIPIEHIKTRNINQDVEFNKDIRRRKNHRSNSYDVNMSKNWIEPYVSSITNNPCQSTAAVLTERVMLWLDLARQSQEERIKKFEDDEIERKQKRKALTTLPNWMPYLDYDNIGAKEAPTSLTSKNNRADLHLNDLSILKSPMKLTQSATDIMPSSQSTGTQDEDYNDYKINVQQISSKLEKSHDISDMYDSVVPKYSKASSKRQLHIFMPNVPKKRIDSEGRSILSDISSRYSTKIKFSL